MLHPASAAEAWNVVRLSTDNTERLLRENRLTEIPDQISLCSPALRALVRFAPLPDAQKTVAAGAIRASVTLTSLAQGAVAGDRPFTTQTLAAFRLNLRDLAASFDPGTVAADIFVCPMHPDVASADPAARCAKCGMTLLPRRIPYSFVFTAPGEPTLRLTAATADPLAAGQPARVTIRLTHADGSPVLLPELLVVHTQPIHLLVVDGALGDYHHEHPLPTGTPGEYAFTFTPATPGPYRLFADLVAAATGVQEYPRTDLSASSPFTVRIPDKSSTETATVDGLTFHLAWGTPDAAPPRANQAQSLRVTVTGADDRPFTSLEPVMAAFAHLVGFYDDGGTVVHLHPQGPEADDPALRGGPALDFKFYPPKPGFLRLYCQVQAHGKQVFAPFNVTVAP